MESILSLHDLEAAALPLLPLGSREFFRNGAGRQVTLRANESAFTDLIIRPRSLVRDVSTVDQRTTLLGRTLAASIAIAPTAMHALAHPEGELATARAAAAAGVLYTLSTTSIVRMWRMWQRNQEKQADLHSRSNCTSAGAKTSPQVWSEEPRHPGSKRWS